MNLQNEITQRSREIQTDGYAMSIGEVASLYRDKEIDIHPEFQRIFRWKPDKKSRLIESILLGIPIPPIFVSQRSDGAWDVIDGVQRLSTVLEFMGEFRDEDGVYRQSEPLSETDYLSQLKGVVWKLLPSEDEGSDVPDSQEEVTGGGEEVTVQELPESLRRDFKRAKLEFRIIKKNSDANAKYDLFDRLNSGAVLSPQESRNCLLVMLNVTMFRVLEELSLHASFKACTPLSERQEEQAYRQELVLRFFSQLDYSGGEKELNREYGEYLTRWMRENSPSFGEPSSPVDPDVFRRTFDLLDTSLGEDVFRRWNGERHLGAFSISSFEFVTSGVGANLELWEGRPQELAARIRAAWSSPEMRDNSGTGVSPRRRVPKLINKSRKYFGPQHGDTLTN